MYLLIVHQATLPLCVKDGLLCLGSFTQMLAQVFRVLGRQDVNVKMMSQGASKTNISLIVSDSEAKQVVRALHDEFFSA